MKQHATISLLTLALAGAYAPAEAQEPAPGLPETVTFSEHIASIVYKNCTSCHRPGEGAPFSLTNYRETRKHGLMIQVVTEDRIMPPWHPEPGHGRFRDPRRLSDEDIALIERWTETGMKRGDPALAPPPPEFTAGWQLGKPDLVVTMDESFEVPANGPDIYRNFVVPLNLKEDRWVKAVEVRPGARQVLHHTLFFLDRTGQARELDASDPGPGFSNMGFRRTGSLGGWAVGGQPNRLPEGLALPLKRGSDLILASHFHPSGRAESERTTIGLYFSDSPPKRTITAFQVPAVYGRFNNLDIPAGDERYVLKDRFVLPVDTELITASGHAHYLCREMRAYATLPDGRKEPLLWIKRWDFNWQERYIYKQAVLLPAGTVITSELIYDNSVNNPNQTSDPPQRVRWGLGSTDEMGSIIFSAVAGDESQLGTLNLASRKRITRGPQGRRLTSWLGMLKGFDKNGDERLGSDELPGRFAQIIDLLDSDEDGHLSFAEIESLLKRPEAQDGQGRAEGEAPPRPPAKRRKRVF